MIPTALNCAHLLIIISKLLLFQSITTGIRLTDLENQLHTPGKSLFLFTITPHAVEWAPYPFASSCPELWLHCLKQYNNTVPVLDLRDLQIMGSTCLYIHHRLAPCLYIRLSFEALDLLLWLLSVSPRNCGNLCRKKKPTSNGNQDVLWLPNPGIIWENTFVRTCLVGSSKI